MRCNRFLPTLMLAGTTLLGVALPFDASACWVDDSPPMAGTPDRISFNFKDASFEQVIDFFSRSTGLPVIWETDAPQGTLSYRSQESYDRAEALRVLNIILQSRGVMLRVSDDMLYLQKLDQMQRSNIPTFIGQLPADVTNDQIVTVVRPLEIAMAKPMAERLAQMVASYGSITAMEQQNALVVTETAAQVRRLLAIVEELDRADPDSHIEIFAIRHAKAKDLMEPLKALMSQRVERFVIDQRGQQQKIEEDDMSGLSLSADDRTNSIIARGTHARIQGLREAIALLDVPAATGARTIRTVALAVLAPRDAANRLNEVYRKLPDADRPSVIAMDNFGQVTIVGNNSAIDEGVALLHEIDGGGEGDAIDSQRRMAVVAIEHAQPASIINALRGLLNNRQVAMTKMVAGADGRSLILSGPRDDVANIESIIPALDRPSRVDREVRMLTLNVPQAADVMQRARDLFEKQTQGDDTARELAIEFNDADRVLTLVGTAATINRFTNTLRAVESAAVIDRETRQIGLAHARPSQLVNPLRTLGRQLLESHDTPFVEPAIHPIDPLDALLITAMPEQFGVLNSLIETLDRPTPSDYQFRVISLAGVSKPQALIERTESAYAMLTLGRGDDDRLARPTVQHDELTGNLIVSGRTEAVGLYERAVNEARRLLPPAREGRMIALRQANASDVIGPLQDLLDRTSPIDSARTIPAPVLDVVEHTNSLYVVAEPAQHQMIERYVRELDRIEPTDLPPLRLIQVRAADAANLSRLLRERYNARPQEQRREQPVEVNADAATNTLIVTAHEDVFGEIREFVDSVNRAGEAEAERETMIFPLKLARATDVATALEKLYPEPPMPRDRLNRPMPHLQQPREVHVAADAGTNTLIIEAPTERRASFEALVERLDRVELPPSAELRTYHISRGDPREIANTLRDLARQGVMSERGDDGQRVEVTVQVEPVSRTLILAGDSRTFRMAEEILSDLEAVPVERSLRVFEITGADPERIAEQALRLYDEQTAEIPGASKVSVEVDRDGSTLLAIAEDEAMFRFAGILNQLQDSIGPPPDVRLVPLDYATAAEVVEFLEGLSASELGLVTGRSGPRPIFEAIQRTNSVLIAAQPQQHQIIRSLIDSLDVLEDEQMPPLRILQLRTADANNLANALMRHYNQRPSEERATRRVQVAADANTNSLIVAAHPDMLPEVQAIVDELNRADRRDYDGREIRIFPLRVARAEELARTIDEMFPEPPMPVDIRNRPRPDLQEPREVVVRADRQTNSLIVDAPINRMPGFEQLVEQLDRQQFLEETEVRTYAVVYAELAAVAQTLRDLSAAGTLSPAQNDRAGGRAGVTIATEPVSRTLIVAGPADIFTRVEQVLSELDAQRAGMTTSLRFVKLQHARAEQIVPLVRELVVGEQSSVPGAAKVHIAADPRLNAIVISAPPAVLNVAEELVGQFDVDPAGVAGASPRAVRVLAVRNAEATDLAENLQAIFAEGDQLDVPPTIRVDATSNTLLVRATEAQMKTIEEVVARVDMATVASARQMQLIRVDPSKASAEEVARTLQRMLERNEPSRVRVITVEELRREREQPREEQVIPAGGTSMLESDSSQSTRTLFASSASSAISAVHLLALSMLSDEADSRQPAADSSAPDITIAVDPVSNSLIILGSPRAVDHLTTLAQQVQDQIPAAPGTIRYVELAVGSDANHMARLLNQSLAQMTPAGGDRGEFSRRVSIIADQPGNALIVSCNDNDFETVGDLIAALSRPSAMEFDIRTIVLERASAASVANAIQRLYDDRSRITAAMRSRRDTGRRISIIGDEVSRTVLVAASDEDFAQISELVKQFDSPQATSALEFRVFELRHARAAEIQDLVQGLTQDLMWGQGPVFWSPATMRGGRQHGTLAIRADARLNALIVTGEGDRFSIVENLIDILDAPPTEGRERLVRMYRVQHIRTNLVADIIREAFGDGGRSARRWWEPPDPTLVQVRLDDRTNTLIVSASQSEHDEIASLIASIDDQVAPADQQMRVLALEYAQAGEMARTLRAFLVNRADVVNAPAPTAVILPSQSTNSLIVSASEDEMLTIRSLLAELDQDDLSGERVVEILVLREGEATDIARIVNQQFGGRARGPQAVTITPDIRTNSIIVSATRQQFAQVQSLVERLDTPRASDETIIRTYALESARAQEVQRLLADTLRLDARGRTEGITIRLEDSDADAVEVKARIVADRRSNSLIVTATEQSFPVIESLIRRLDDVPTATQVEYRIIPLQHALVTDVSFTLQQMSRGFSREEPQPRIDYNRRENQLIIAATTEQFEQINRILREIDQPSQRERITDFVPLQFAGAQQVQEALSVFYGTFAMEADTPSKRNVRIVADPATNSLVISAERDEWEGIRSLLAELDSEEYDSSLQLRVLPLLHADARSVAQAINQAFAGTLERSRAAQPQRQQRRGDDERRDMEMPTVLVESEEWVRASAEPQTNSVIISASRQNIRKIEAIIDTLDVADYAKLPAPQLIPVATGDPRQLAESLTRLYQPAGDRAAATGKGLRIVGDVASNTIIVRADEDEFAQIKALADALQQQAGEQGVAVHVLRLTAAPAGRVASAIRDAYQARARLANQPLSIQVDSHANSLIIASTASLFREIEQTVDQLDALSPGAGQAIFIIELENISPDAARSVIESIGLHQRQPEESVARLVSEPIKVSVLAGRNALIIVANPADRETVVGLLKAVDSEPGMAESQMRLVRLRNASATSVAAILREVLNPAQQQTRTPLALAVQEQVRRLSVRTSGLDQDDLNLDLTKPVRIIVDGGLNALVIGSTEANVRAIEQLIGMFDQLPITDAATVRVFPLQNIAADQFARICRDLFTQGKRIGGVPGVHGVPGIPGGMVGKALMDEIAITTDERTNTVIVAGKEDSVALVEVLTQRLDSDVAAGWVEPRILPLRFADAGELSQTLQSVLVEGATSLPQASPLQRQIGRLRMARNENDGGRVLESDVFQPMTRLVIRPEPQLNALILVGTPMNLEVVSELVKLLDIEAASPSAAVRIYPVQHASASRLARTITQLFDQQVQTKAIRPEDRVIVQADERTNSLIVTTSQRSFAVLETLLTSLDNEIAPDLREIRRIEVQHASATRLANLVQQMMDARLERLRRVQPETADLERATIIAEPRTNSLVIAAGNESFEVIRRLVADLDSSTLTDASLVHVIPVAQGNIDRIADAVRQIMDRRYADQPAEVRTSQKPLVLTDPRTSSLLVAANPEDVAAIENLVQRLAEAPVSTAVGLHVLSVGGGTRVDQLAQRLTRLMNDRVQTLGDSRTPSDRVSIEADLVSNSLIIAATQENLDVIKGLIEVLVQAGADSAEGREVDLIMLATSRASDMVSLLNDLHVREANRLRGDGTVRLTADENLNAVLVNAPPADVRAVRDIISRLDGVKPARVVETRFIPLQSANALETVSLIQNVLSGRGIGSARAGAQSTVLKYVRRIASEHTGLEVPEDIEEITTEMLVGAAIRESITLTPDVRTNTVIVSAPRESMRMIEQMIRDLDASSIGAQNIRIFKLVNADALAMARILTDLFSLQRQGNLFVLRPREAGVEMADAPAMDMSGLTGIELTAVPDERQQLAITVDSRTNSLLVSGTPTYLDLVERVINDLDSQEASERETIVYPLRNATAADVARVVSSFVDTEQQKLISTLGSDQIGSAARLLEREITIVGDEKSNTVLVSASPRYRQRLMEMIEGLDVDPPQVLIQVLLAEVTLDSNDDWGVDMALRASIDSANVTGSFGLASAFVSGLGVPSLAIASTDFDLLIRALQSQGRLQVLSNPSVMAANNEPARIQVGETIRLPTDVSITDAGRTLTSVESEEIGVILSVTPSINPDGFVRMVISPEISNLSARTTQISEDFEAPIITRRTAETTVTVFDGQTIVLGGLISDRFERRDRKVPLLGDIPFVGALFRSMSQETTKTELLIVLTPHVVESPAELRRVQDLTDREIDRLTLPEEVKESIRRPAANGIEAWREFNR